ncbi:MAG: Holliday junction resolvase RuvX [Micrococcaceae bacterium]
MRIGVRLAVDVGQVRVGVAKSDAMGILASPVKTLLRDELENTDIHELVDIAEELQAIEIIFGFPKLLSGKEGNSAKFSQEYATLVACKLPQVSVRLVDERLSTVRAHETLRENGIKTIKHRKVIDQVAAVDILQHALDMERNTAKLPGKEVQCRESNKEQTS